MTIKIDHKGQRAGPWSKKEKQYISDQAGQIPPEQIANNLKRNPNSVLKYMNKNGLMKYYHKKDLDEDELQNIRRTKYWDTLIQEFTPEELDIFQYHWKETVKQFRDDIFHTEELQIVDAIKLEIMMNRCQIKQKQAYDLIHELREKIEKEENSTEPNEERLDSLSRTLTQCYAGTDALTKEFTTLLQRKTEAFQKLKATREQRIQQIESSKESLVGWIKDLHQNYRKTVELGLKMEKMRIATEAEYQRLSEFHTFMDGQVDQPILNYKTVKQWKNSTQKNTSEEDINTKD